MRLAGAAGASGWGAALLQAGVPLPPPSMQLQKMHARCTPTLKSSSPHPLPPSPKSTPHGAPTLKPLLWICPLSVCPTSTAPPHPPLLAQALQILTASIDPKQQLARPKFGMRAQKGPTVAPLMGARVGCVGCVREEGWGGVGRGV